MSFVLPDGYSDFPIQLKAVYQLARHLSLIGGEGYNLNFQEVYVDRHDFENVENYPAVNVIWGPERVQNANQNDNTMGVYSVMLSVFLDVILSSQTPTIERGLIKADIEKYFLSPGNRNDCLPEAEGEESTGGAATVQSLMVASATPYGDAQTAPKCKLEIELKMWYKTKMGDPYTRP